MPKGNASGTVDDTIDHQIFKKTDQTVVPSANKDPIPNPTEKLMKNDPPVHDANVFGAGHDEKDGNKHDMENKFGGR